LTGRLELCKEIFLIFKNIGGIQEDNIQKLENEIEIMRTKAERNGVKLSDEKALELIQSIRSTVVNELPDFQPQQVPAQPTEGRPQT